MNPENGTQGLITSPQIEEKPIKKVPEFNKDAINNRFLAERKAKKKEEHIGIPPPLKKPEKKQVTELEKTNSPIKTTSTKSKSNAEDKKVLDSGFAIAAVCVVLGLILLFWLLS